MPSCAFCRLPNERPEQLLIFNEDAYVIVPRGWEDGRHLLVVPRRHVTSYEGLSGSFHDLVAAAVRRLKRESGCTSVNVTTNDGPDAGQTMEHFHTWVVARPPEGKSSGKGLATLVWEADNQA